MYFNFVLLSWKVNLKPFFVTLLSDLNLTEAYPSGEYMLKSYSLPVFPEQYLPIDFEYLLKKNADET